ncbi:MAG TPA: GMC family oxidoreductase N-terminal domain-containing protein [Myxococcota bacterium]|nr:GMC family oxidoreductase N-terminal domain-containing protein [Myxococcota bacterium]
MSVDLAAASAPLDLRAEVCVIGSGAGGAVAAAELARGGLDVVILEQGRHWTSRDFTQREDEMLPRLFEEAGMRQTEDGSITVLQGRNVGGSTVHNLCYSFRTPDPILALWREEHGLSSLTSASLAPSFERVERMLKVKQIREDEVNALNRIVRAGAEKLGYSGFVTKHNREGCVQAGYCILGCSYDAKQSMLVTYVPEAERLGARLFASARAERIEATPGAPRGRVRAVHGHAVGADGRPGVPFRVEAPVVVLAAGAVASPDLLLRSELGNGTGQVGAHLHLHPSVMAAGFFDEPIHAYRGIPQSYYVDEFIDLERDPRAGYVLMPIAGFPVLTAAQLPGFGREHFAHMRRFAHLAGLLALLHDQSEGSVGPGATPARPRIRYALDERDRRQLAEGLLHCVEVLLAGGAREVLVPYARDPLTLRPGDDLAPILRRGVAQSGPNAVPLASTHPQSTCRMGGDPLSSVVGEYGECHEVAGLFVADMGVFPTSLGAPPQITTAALADRTAHHVLARRGELLG